MNKFYCFNCQQEVEPKKILGFKICPHCFHRIVDSGDGFYLVCDKCGADNPVSAKSCIKCKSSLNGGGNLTSDKIVLSADFILKILTNIAFLILSVALLVFVFYLSFYLFMAFLILGAAYYLISKITTKIG